MKILKRFKRLFVYLLEGDFIAIYRRVTRKFSYYDIENRKFYQKWLKQISKYQNQSLVFSNFKYRPLISILLVLTDKVMMQTIESILKQKYDNWQLCIYTNHDLNLELIEGNTKINIISSNKLCNEGMALNNLLSISKGDYIMILRQGDILDLLALSFYVRALNERKDYKIIYTDEDRINKTGERLDPFLKSDFLPNLLYSLDYISRGSIFSANSIKKVGGFCANLSYCHVYDIAIKIINNVKEEQVHHIPYILYHCLTADKMEYSKYLDIASTYCNIVENSLGTKLTPFQIDNERIFYRIHPNKLSHYPTVSIIIPTKDKLNLLKNCIDSIINKTSYPNYEIIVVDNQSTEEDAIDYLKNLNNPSIRVLEYKKPYNYSAINNYAMDFVKGEVICLLNNDTEVINSSWLEEMILWLQKPNVGIVGAKLYYPETNNIQHAGMYSAMLYHNKHRYIAHGYINQPSNTRGYLNCLYTAHEVSSVTAACLIMNKKLFTQIGGFDEKNTPTSYSDVDLCFRLREQNYKIMWTPYAELYHHESATRGPDIKRSNISYNYMIKRWPDYFTKDIHLHPLLCLHYKTQSPVLFKDNYKILG